MQCKNCELWIKRPLPKDKRFNYPAGACLNVSFYEKRKQQYTLPDTNCDRGERK